MKVRLVKKEEINRIMEIVAIAKEEMYRSNIFQWDESYPKIELLLEDIDKGDLYGVEVEGKIGAFACINSEIDDAYENIDWEIKDKCYSIHRLAVDTTLGVRGMAGILFDFTEELAKKEGIKTIHLDTYSENFKAQNLFLKKGYNKICEFDLKPNMKKFFAYEKIM